LKEVTLSILPTVVERSGGLDLAGGPRIILDETYPPKTRKMGLGYCMVEIALS